jgi:hypothetical protein
MRDNKMRIKIKMNESIMRYIDSNNFERLINRYIDYHDFEDDIQSEELSMDEYKERLKGLDDLILDEFDIQILFDNYNLNFSLIDDNEERSSIDSLFNK